ncbi:MAG: methylmalonyl-CoA epimerase [Acidobacteria bacterium]|nr:methylmalonyl-CoA epimerase [Acidobacteriota bacterium]
MKLDHLGIAVRSVEESLKFYQEVLGLPVQAREDVPEQGVHAALLPVGETRFELLEATHEESPIAKFIAKRGEGIHHLCIEVENIEAVLDQLKAAGMRLVDETPRRGVGGHKIAFVHPSGTHGVLIELVEKERLAISDRPSAETES